MGFKEFVCYTQGRNQGHNMNEKYIKIGGQSMNGKYIKIEDFILIYKK